MAHCPILADLLTSWGMCLSSFDVTTSCKSERLIQRHTLSDLRRKGTRRQGLFLVFLWVSSHIGDTQEIWLNLITLKYFPFKGTLKRSSSTVG